MRQIIFAIPSAGVTPTEAQTEALLAWLSANKRRTASDFA